jgi:hypothetical protein
LPISVYSPKVNAPASKVQKGTATVTTNERPASASTPVSQNADGSTSTAPSSGNTNTATNSNGNSAINSSSASGQTYSPSYKSELIANPIDNFASVTPLWTLAVLTPKQFNNPRSYRSGDAAFSGDAYVDQFGRTIQSGIVFASAGRYDSTRVGTEYGAPEYFVNNFVMTSVIAPNQKTGNSNAIKFTFDIFEPYSMGLFLQSLQNAALKAGYASYLDNTPYLLKLDFQGYKDDGTPVKLKVSKYFTCKLLSVKFDVNESGSSYKIEAIPFNHQAMGKVTNTIYKDISLVGGSVLELLATGESSLSAFLNKEQKGNVDGGKQQTKQNEYVFIFPKDAHDSFGLEAEPTASDGGATVTPFEYIPVRVVSPPSATTNFGNNEIGDSDMGFEANSGGTYPMQKESEVYNEETGKIDKTKIQISPNKREFKFTQGQSITHIITQIIISSRFGKETFNNISKVDGTIAWFKIDVQVQLLDYDTVAKDFAKKIIFRIVPYRVHYSFFMNPTSAPGGYPGLEKKIAKRYDYIYTGQNNNIIKFDLQFNTTFFSGANPSLPEKTGAVTNPGAQAGSGKEVVAFKSQPQSGVGTITSKTGVAPVKNDPNLLWKQYSGGSSDSSPEKKVAEAFQRSFLNSGDMIVCNIELMGDTFWIVDSGIGNYIASKFDDAVTVDGTPTYEGSEVYIYVTFRTPSDILEGTGLYGFPNEGKISGFSGIYKVLTCESRFNDGKFTQLLKLTRMPGQATDFSIQKRPAEDLSSALQVQAVGVVKNVEETPVPAPAGDEGE